MNKSLSLGLLLTALTPSALSAQVEQVSESLSPSRFTLDQTDPEQNLPTAAEANAHPLEFAYFLLDVEARAEAARARGDWAGSAAHHRVLTRLAPQAAKPYGALCLDYEGMGRREDALTACRAALARNGAQVDDYARLVRLVAARPGALDSEEVADATAAIAHLKETPSHQLAAYHLQCELAVRGDELDTLAECAGKLRELAPNDTKANTFVWVLALKQQDFAGAHAAIERARKLGLANDALARMEASTRDAVQTRADSQSDSELTERTRGFLRWGSVLAIVTLLALLVARRLTRPGTLQG